MCVVLPQCPEGIPLKIQDFNNTLLKPSLSERDTRHTDMSFTQKLCTAVAHNTCSLLLVLTEFKLLLKLLLLLFSLFLEPFIQGPWVIGLLWAF